MKKRSEFGVLNFLPFQLKKQSDEDAIRQWLEKRKQSLKFGQWWAVILFILQYILELFVFGDPSQFMSVSVRAVMWVLLCIAFAMTRKEFTRAEPLIDEYLEYIRDRV